MNWKDGGPIVEFESQQDWEFWLDENHTTSSSVWIRFYKKASGKKTITYDEALDGALCFGWIDGVVNKFDEKSYLQRFTPRTKRSKWSKRNTEHIERLIQLKKMRPAGLSEVEAAKKDGRWDNAYAPSTEMTIPNDFMEALRKNKKAQEFFNTLNKANLYAIGYRLNTASKPETRERRKQQIISMLENGEKFH